MSTAAQAATRTPAGHPEGYLEAFAVIHRNSIADIRRVKSGERPLRDYPTAQDGLRGLGWDALKSPDSPSLEKFNLGTRWGRVGRQSSARARG